MEEKSRIRRELQVRSRQFGYGPAGRGRGTVLRRVPLRPVRPGPVRTRLKPSADVQRVMGDDLMSYGPVHSVVAESQRATRIALKQPELREAIEFATTRPDPAERP